MEPSRSIEIKVGIFVVIATVLTIGFIIALGGDKAIFHSNYHLKMLAEDTGGLSLGSVVQVAGIQCGNVTGVDFNKDNNQVTITLKIDRRCQDKITKGALAGVHTQGALGDKYVMIKPAPSGAASLQDGDVIESEPSTDLLSTLGKSGDKVERIFEIMDEVQKLVRGLNDKSFSQNVSETARNLKASTASLDEILDSIKGKDPQANKLKKSLDHLSSILEKIDRGQGTLGGLINDPTIHEDLKTILGGAKRSKLLKFLIHQATKNGEEGEKDEKKGSELK